MAKKRIVDKNKKRAIKISKSFSFRKRIHDELRTQSLQVEQQFLVMKIKDQMRDSSPIRYRNRCSITGRPRGFRGAIGLSRGALRFYASFGLIAGVRKV